MRDNGLLKEFYLDSKSLPGSEEFKHNFSYVVSTDYISPIVSLTDKTHGKSFYLKDCRDKLSVDAEVLLSQVYSKAGLQSAIYLPVSGGIAMPKGKQKNNICHGASSVFIPVTDGQSVVSNDVETDRTIFFSDYSYDVFGKWEFAPLFPERAVGGRFPFKDYFTKDGARDFIKMHLFDVACKNFDRSDNNFFIEVDDNNLISGVKLIDFGASAWEEPFMPYENSLGEDCYRKQREEMIDELSTNESVLEAMPREEMCEALSKINYAETAQEIGDVIGYKIEQDLIKKFEDSTSEVLQSLEA